MSVIETPTTINVVDKLVKDWMFSKKLDDEDYERPASDLMFGVLERLKELSRNDRKLFWKEVNSRIQNGD